jgi:uncharacterized phage infection (PIP) family protein YhgE
VKKTEKMVAETVAEGMTPFIATVTANISSLHPNLHETQEAVMQFTAQLSEIQELRDAAVQLSTQHNVLKELRDAVTSAHRSEMQQLRDVVQQLQLTTQQQELKQLHDVVQQTSTQVGELKAKKDAPRQNHQPNPGSSSATPQSHQQHRLQSIPVIRCEPSSSS